MIRRPPRSTLDRSSAASDVYKRQDLKYARWGGSGWLTETVDGANGDAVGSQTSIAVDAANRPFIAYLDDTNGVLKLAQWTGSAWQIQTVDGSGAIGGAMSLALDSAGRPHIAYIDTGSAALKYGRWTGTLWDLQIIDSIGYVGFVSMAIDSANVVHVGYYDAANGDLKVARGKANYPWNIQTVDSNGDVGGYVSLAVDMAGNPHLAYYDWTQYTLKYAYLAGTTWVVQTVADTGLVGYTSLCLLYTSPSPRERTRSRMPSSA